MTTRARTGNSTAKTTAAKKSTARKPAPKTAKRAAPRSPRKSAPALSLVKETPDKAPTPRVDLRYQLPVRRRLFVGPMGATEQAAVRAALAAAAARLPVPVRSWNGSTAQLADGTLLIHNPGPDRRFTAHIACPHGAIHGWPIRTLNDLQQARAQTAACAQPHSTADQAITLGVGPVPAPKPSVVLVLREGVRRATASTAETQPLTADAITDGLAARAADKETAKEHPEP